jgi:hypothetical protein
MLTMTSTSEELVDDASCGDPCNGYSEEELRAAEIRGQQRQRGAVAAVSRHFQAAVRAQGSRHPKRTAADEARLALTSCTAASSCVSARTPRIASIRGPSTTTRVPCSS